MKRKGKKKSNISISRTTLYTQKIKFCMQIVFFSKNVSLNTKINLRLEKKTQKIFWGQFQKYLQKFLSSPSKKC